jgi:DNA-binding IclR family transcriptional regulator
MNQYHDKNAQSGANASVKSAERVLDIIGVVAREPKGMTFMQLLHALALPKSSLYALLGVLTRRGYLQLDADSGVYTLGIRVWEDGQAYLQHHNLVQEVRPVMDRIVAVVNEVSQLAVLDGIENVYLAKVDCSHPIRLQSEVGRRLYAYATGLGKVLLAHLSAEELATRLDGRALVGFTPNTITSQRQLSRALTQVRETGFAVDNEEYTPGLRCVAVPIADHQGKVVAAMSVSIPMMRGGIEQLSTALALLAGGSLEVSRRLGWAGKDMRLVRLADRPKEAARLLQIQLNAGKRK